MDVLTILPVLLPVTFVQIALQIYTIRHVLHNRRIASSYQPFLILAILIFNSIAMSSYLFYISNQKESNKDDLQRYFRYGVIALLTLAFQIFALQIGFQFESSGSYSTIRIYLVAMYVLMIAMEGMTLAKRPIFTWMFGAIMYLFALLLEITLLTDTIPFITIWVIIASFNQFQLRHTTSIIIGYIVTYLGFMLYKGSLLYQDLQSDESTIYIFTTVIVTVLVMISFVTLRKQLRQNLLLQDLISQLHEQQETIEQMTVKEERMRMAADIHDHVGHTLTTAIIQMESVLQQPDTSPLIAEKVGLANQQVKNGLNQIRLLVRNVDIDFEQPFTDNLQALIKSIKQTTELVVHADIDVSVNLVALQQKVLLQSIKEFVTNSVKHGDAEEINILVTTNHNYLECTLSNNGKADTVPTYGFGLTQMERSVQSIGGVMNVSASQDLGFIIYFKIPLGGS